MVNLRHSCPITRSEGAKTFVTRLCCISLPIIQSAASFANIIFNLQLENQNPSASRISARPQAVPRGMDGSYGMASFGGQELSNLIQYSKENFLTVFDRNLQVL